jgi:hypothetical protein
LATYSIAHTLNAAAEHLLQPLSTCHYMEGIGRGKINSFNPSLILNPSLKIDRALRERSGNGVLGYRKINRGKGRECNAG